jgi:hypothetical protein
MDLMTPLAKIADASLGTICISAEVGSGTEAERTEAELAYGLIATCTDVLVEELGPHAPKLLSMCATAKHAKHCMLKARANAAEIKELLEGKLTEGKLTEGKACDLDDIHRRRSEYNALHFNVGAFCRKDLHQVVFDQTVSLVLGNLGNLVLGQFEKAVIEAAAKPENVFRVPAARGPSDPSAPSRSFVAAPLDAACNDGACAGVGLVPGNVAPNTPATLDPLGVGAALYSNGPDDTAKLYADASAVADSAEFKMLSLRAFCAAGASGHSSSYSTQDKTLRVWRAILAFVERDPQEHAKLVDVTVLLQDPAHKTVTAAVLPTLLRPSLRLLAAVTAISPSFQKGDLMAFAMNYAAAAQRMAQGLKPGQCAYFTMARPNRRQTGAESTKSAESVEPAEEATEEPEPSEPRWKRARTDSTTVLSAGLSGPLGATRGRESTVA